MFDTAEQQDDRGSVPLAFLYIFFKIFFNELLKMFDGMNHATLTKQLRQLEEFGVVHREVYHQVPPKVEYSLTELGHKLEPTLVCLSEWGRNILEKEEKYRNRIKEGFYN